MEMFAAHYRFDPANDESLSWSKYVEWSGFRQISELVSTDSMLCPLVLKVLIDEDWRYNVHADFKTFFFHDLEYLKRRIAYDPTRHNLLSIIERPDSPPIPQNDLEFCGYDILDSYDSISVLSNCGGFPAIFDSAEVNRYGLLDDLGRATGISAQLRDTEPECSHCCDCRVWSLCRYVGKA